MQHVFPGRFEPSVDVEMDDHGQPVAHERFNAYGLLRSLSGDVDSWYTECKLDLNPGSLNQASTRELKQLQQPVNISRRVVSFHYMSQREVNLTFLILDRQLPPEATLLEQLWPRTSPEAGHYSRVLRDHAEAEKLAEFFMKATIENCDQ